MSITISYTGEIEEFEQAFEQANEIMQSEEFFDLVASRETPFDESSPKNLSPILIADIFRKSNLALTLMEYATERTTGGRFIRSRPTIVWLNTNALHRGACRLSCVLVHECVHALSFDSKDYNFSHIGNGRDGNLETAPYWIQDNVQRQHCAGLKGDVMLVEVIDDPEGV